MLKSRGFESRTFFDINLLQQSSTENKQNSLSIWANIFTLYTVSLVLHLIIAVADTSWVFTHVEKHCFDVWKEWTK